MKYDLKEYKFIFDTPMARDQERAIVATIMNLLNNNKYDNLEEFIQKNQNYQDFLKNNNMQTAIKHFGNTLKEDDYIKILENLKVLTNKKQSFEEDNIKTTNIGNNQFNSFEGEDKTYFVDNSRSGKTIEEQMRDLQNTEQQFQTTDARQNTENMFKELENRKEGLNLHYLHDINYDLLTEKEKEFYQIANDYQQSITGIIRVDLQKGIIVDEQNNIMKIEKYNGEFSIIKDNGTKQEAENQKTYQKKLIPKPNTIYSN